MDRSISVVMRSETPVFEFWTNDGFESPDEKIEKVEQETLVWNFIQKLPSKYGVSLVLLRYDEMGNKEIAEVMDIAKSKALF